MAEDIITITREKDEPGGIPEKDEPKIIFTPRPRTVKPRKLKRAEKPKKSRKLKDKRSDKLKKKEKIAGKPCRLETSSDIRRSKKSEDSGPEQSTISPAPAPTISSSAPDNPELSSSDEKIKSLLFKYPDTRYPPPPLPPSYGTYLYPAISDYLAGYEPANEQMKAISMRRKDTETKFLRAGKNDGYKSDRGRNYHLKRYCRICSEHSSDIYKMKKPICHTHNSSLDYRINAPVDTNGNFHCITCKNTPHSHKSGRRYSVLVSSSTMDNWQGRRDLNNYAGDDIHLDFITIPGGTIQILTHAFLAEYGKTHRPVDVLLVSGLNDVLRGRSVGQIMADISVFRTAVKSLPGYLGSASTFSVATPPFPPKFTSLPGDSRQIQANKLDLMVDLTERIKLTNRSANHPFLPTGIAPCFHTWGMRSGILSHTENPEFLLERMTGHRRGEWREPDPDDMLHLSDETRVRMGKAVLTYFKVLYGMM